MALPVIDVPTFDVEIPGIKGSVKFRPFLVKENKILKTGILFPTILDLPDKAVQIND